MVRSELVTMDVVPIYGAIQTNLGFKRFLLSKHGGVIRCFERKQRKESERESKRERESGRVEERERESGREVVAISCERKVREYEVVPFTNASSVI